jgi:hypothetical protein
VALALYPGLILHAGEESVQQALAPEAAPVAAEDLGQFDDGWTGYAPLRTE